MDVPHPRPVGIKELRDNLRSLAGSLQRGEHYLVLRHNRPVGALIPYEDLLALTDASTALYVSSMPAPQVAVVHWHSS